MSGTNEHLHSIGQIFREARESQGLTLNDVCLSTKIRPEQIRALEEGNFSAFAGEVYVRAFVRDYARFLDLDEGPLLEQISLSHQPQPSASPKPHHKPVQTQLVAGIAPWLIAGAVAVSLVVAALSLSGYQIIPHRSTSPGAGQQAVVVETEENNAGVAQQEPSIRSAVRLRLRAEAPSWVRVQTGDETLFEGMLSRGTSQQFASPSELTIRLGNAGGVWVRLNDEDEQLLGDPGQVVNRTFIAGVEDSDS